MPHRNLTRATLLLGVAALSFAPLLGAQQGETITRETRPFVPVTDEMLRDPDPGDWMMNRRTYDFQAYSPLDQINRDNVDQLQVAWMRAMDEGPQQTQPLVYDGVMYLANNNDHIQALDATTGDLLWDYERQLLSDMREYVHDWQPDPEPGHLRQPHLPPDGRRAPARPRRPHRRGGLRPARWPTTARGSPTRRAP